jgi:cellulose biosynthesis protein BcsQ
MALVNVGVLMALDGHKVLLVDWDLEAPGLDTFFAKSAVTDVIGNPDATPGIVDLLRAQSENRTLPWRDCLLKVKFKEASLDLISAGQRSNDYRSKLQQLDWATLFEQHNIGNILDGLRDEWRSAYDFVLVDSRTGITDIGDICTVLLPDAIIAMFVANHQNVEGVRLSVDRAIKARSKLPVNRSRLMVVPVHGRDESKTEYDLSLRWQGICEKEFGQYFKDWLPEEISIGEALSKLFIPYVAVWSFGERIPVLESRREMEDPTTIGSAYLRLTTLLIGQLDWYAVFERTGIGDLKTAKLELSTIAREYDNLKLETAKKESRTRRLVFSISAAAAVLTAVISVISTLKIITDTTLPSVTYTVCAGELQANCPTNAIYQYCGFSADDWAKSRCSKFTTKTISDTPGNKCGYAIFQITCIPRAGIK